MRRILMVLTAAVLMAAMLAFAGAGAALAAPTPKVSNSAEALDFPTLGGTPRETGNEGELNFGNAQEGYAKALPPGRTKGEEASECNPSFGNRTGPEKFCTAWGDR